MTTTHKKPKNEPGNRTYKRFNLSHQIEHWIFITSFIMLAITGLIQRYASSQISIAIISALGGVENVRIIHRISATVMMIIVVYHIGAVAYRIYVRRVRLTMLPVVADLRAAIDSIKYYFNSKVNPPQQGRYTYEEKVEYWAVAWGTVVMGITGFLMWNPIASARLLPGQFIPAAKVAHSAEALLAVLAIIIWHFYQIFIKYFNRSMYTGYIGEEEMIEEHPLELADIKAGIANRPLDPKEKRKRERIFWPTYGIIAAVLLAFIYWFVSFEETALATIPPAESVTVFVPLTPTPLPTPLPTSTPVQFENVTWDAVVQDLFQERCGECHNGSLKLGGLNLSSYRSALKGGNTGTGILPGDPDNSQIVIIQSPGDHKGQLSLDELELIIAWIKAGAEE